MNEGMKRDTCCALPTLESLDVGCWCNEADSCAVMFESRTARKKRNTQTYNRQDEKSGPLAGHTLSRLSRIQWRNSTYDVT
jgi:hypothetical protein